MLKSCPLLVVEGANDLDPRNEIDHDEDVVSAVSERAGDESEELAAHSVPVLLVHDFRSRILLHQLL
jgi:hypothetical protein